jgi:phosphoacetylglucosamine mutase
MATTGPGPAHPGVKLAYGTAGFRAKADILDSTFFRMGVLAALRSRARGGLAVGLMVTASHNPEPDNGIKLIDSDGGMLEQSWEAHATRLANAADESLASEIAALAESLGVAAGGGGGGRVLVARDTRPHSARLAALALEGVAHAGGGGEDFGLLTTPQLHHIVRHANGTAGAGPHVGPAEWASEAGYYEMLATAYAQLVTPPAVSRGPALVVDAACGVGAPQLAALQRRMGDALLPIKLINGVGEGELNAGCGAEFVQKGRKPPRGLDKPPVSRACSLDGDADRIVYHYWRADPSEWRLLDCDKLAALYASFVCGELSALELQPALSVAVVQTAYANGASGNYIRSLGVPTRIAKTGVKFVHHVAVQYDVSIYFEANGHGTLLFNDAAVDAIKAASGSADERKAEAARRLLAARQLVNQAIGDALSDLLLAEAILILKGWGVEEWDALYDDLPSRQTKLAVADRAAITVTADETKTIEPASLQPELDRLAAMFEGGRCFVRPSGTEDVVRVYAEAATQAAADELALHVAQTTWRLAGGVGQMPTAAVA